MAGNKSHITLSDALLRIASRRGRNYLISKSSTLTAKLSLDKSPKRFLLAPLDSSKREAGRLYRANIRLSRISLSPIGVRELAIGI